MGSLGQYTSIEIQGFVRVYIALSQAQIKVERFMYLIEGIRFGTWKVDVWTRP